MHPQSLTSTTALPQHYKTHGHASYDAQDLFTLVQAFAKAPALPECQDQREKAHPAAARPIGCELLRLRRVDLADSAAYYISAGVGDRRSPARHDGDDITRFLKVARVAVLLVAGLAWRACKGPATSSMRCRQKLARQGQRKTCEEPALGVAHR